MQNARNGLFVSAYKGKLYAVGGCQDKRMEIYDPIVDSWSYWHISTKEMKSFIQGCTISHKYVHQN